MSVQIATRLDDDQAELFRKTTKGLGTTPADALRMFVSMFNDCRGFPYEVRLPREVEPFATEEEASDFASSMALRMADEAR